MKGRILILGSGGQLGQEFLSVSADYSSFEVIGLDRDACDVVDPDSVRAAVEDHNPDVLINCAAYTKVDKAEEEPELAQRINGLAPGTIAEECERHGIIMVHFSTDYVFDGKSDRPYTESDDPNPLSVYGQTKLEGERRVLQSSASALVIRGSWLYSVQGKNFYLTMRRLSETKSELKVVDDQVSSPTYTGVLVKDLLDFLVSQSKDRLIRGLYHYSHDGEASWCEFANQIFERTSSSCKAVALSTEEFGAKAPRPAYSKLDSTKFFRMTGGRAISWIDALQECINKEINS